MLAHNAVLAVNYSAHDPCACSAQIMCVSLLCLYCLHHRKRLEDIEMQGYQSPVKLVMIGVK